MKKLIFGILGLILVVAIGAGYFVTEKARATFNIPSFHTEYSPYGPWSDWGECKPNIEVYATDSIDQPQECGEDTTGTQTRHRERICIIKLGSGQNQCQLGHIDKEYESRDCPIEVPPCEEEPTPSPSPTPETPGNPPTFAGSSTDAPGVCGDTKPSRVANINVVTTGNKGELQVQWAWPAGGDRVHIEYGLQKNAEHALLNTPNDGNEVIGELKSGQHYWFRVAGVNGCAVGEYSDWFDPLVP